MIYIWLLYCVSLKFISLYSISLMCNCIAIYRLYKAKKEGHYGFFLETNYLSDLYYTNWWGHNNYRGIIIPSVIPRRARPT